MKKFLSVLCLLALLCGLCACGGKSEGYSGSEISPIASDALRFDTQNGDTEGKTAGGLTELTNNGYASCNTEEGYYYITEDPVQLKDGSYAAHLMYMDFATAQEIYLCSDTGCAHDEKSCTAVLPEDSFAWASSRIFVWNGSLYILSKEYDSDGSVTMNLMGDSLIQAESAPASLYQMDLDGTNRKKRYTFDAGLTLEDRVFADEDSIYLITKKLETSMDEGAAVTSSTDRNLVRLAPASGTIETVLSMDFQDGITWQAIGSYDNSLVLEGISYGDGAGASANMRQEEWNAVYNSSKTVFAVLDLDSKALKPVYEIRNSVSHSSANRDGFLYISTDGSGTVEKLDLRSGEKSTLASLRQNNICGMLSGRLICRTWNMTEDYSLYFVDTDTGENSRCGLVNKCNGWALEVMGETERDAIVIYDYEADAHPDGSYTINRYKFALIAKEDLYAGKDNFRPVRMVGKGQ